jgi:uncharacterized protein
VKTKLPGSCVRRTPRSARDPLVPQKADQGVGRGPGGPPYILLCLSLTLLCCARHSPRLSLQPTTLRADARDSAALTLTGPSSPAPRIAVSNGTLENLRRAANGWQADVRSSILPGPIVVRAEFPGLPPAAVSINATLAASDSFEDGTPDFLRLDSERDRQAFRRWFTFLAEAQFFQAPANRPPEISDCAALIRYAYREALHAHDAAWASGARLPLVPAYDSPDKYRYPFTPLGASLFRVTEGPFAASDLHGNAFAQFADARTLRLRNTHFVSRDINAAQPGDLLFYRQESDHLPFHSMIFLGESRIHPDGDRYLLYHTGPGGEIRRPGVQQLLHYPEPEWRPLPGNLNFLGVFRWNILRRA